MTVLLRLLPSAINENGIFIYILALSHTRLQIEEGDYCGGGAGVIWWLFQSSREEMCVCLTLSLLLLLSVDVVVGDILECFWELRFRRRRRRRGIRYTLDKGTDMTGK